MFRRENQRQNWKNSFRNNLDDLPNIIKDFVINKSIWKQKINDTLKKTIFNISNSDRIGATIIYERLKQNNDQ